MGPLLCPAFFWDENVPKTFLLSFIIAYVSYFVQFSWHRLLDLYGASLGLCFYWISKKVSMKNNGIPVGFQRGIYGVSIGFLWDFYGISLGNPMPFP